MVRRVTRLLADIPGAVTRVHTCLARIGVPLSIGRLSALGKTFLCA